MKHLRVALLTTLGVFALGVLIYCLIIISSVIIDFVTHPGAWMLGGLALVIGLGMGLASWIDSQEGR